MRAGSRRGLLGPINRLFRAGTAVGLSDAQLLERFIQCNDEGAESAFNALVERHGPMILAVCRRVLNDEHDAQDALQATFLVLVRKAGTVRKRESIADWLRGVALRVSAHARADAARRRSIERRAVTGSLIAYEAPPPGIDVRDEIEHLPRDLRAAVVLCYLEGLTHEQAALRLGWPVGTVRSRLARARARLRADLTRRAIAPDAALLPALVLRHSSLTAGLIDATVKAAILVKARDAGDAGLVSASAVALTEGVLRTMLVSKLKVTAAILLAIVTIPSGLGLYAYQGSESGAKPGSLTSPPAKVDDRRFNDEELDAYAARVEQLVRRARQEQAGGEWDGAVRDLRKSELVAGEWREALMNRRRSPKGDLPPSLNSAAEPLPADRRLDVLERKVDRLLHALEKDGREKPERQDPFEPTNERPMPKVDQVLHDFNRGAKLMGPNPPRPIGVVQKIDNQTGRVEINLGFDDGIGRDQELAVYRKDRSPQSVEPDYLGRIRILGANPDQAVAKLIAWEGKTIKEGDCVSAEVPPVEDKRLPAKDPQGNKPN
jgi:RNA polymerase sigma factor (sigma-70 family)